LGAKVIKFSTMARLRFLAPLLLWLLTQSCGGTSSSSEDGFPLAGMTADRFVSAAPLIVAAVCGDGVAVVATHTALGDEPLILDDNECNTTNASADASTVVANPLQDLPKSYRGPFRIHSIDSFGTCLVCTGWRADGQALAEYFQKLASSSLAVFGEGKKTVDYGHTLSTEASLWMARCAVSERVSSTYQD
jgi:hypothetical protein